MLRTITTHKAVSASSEGTLNIGDAKSISLQTVCADIGTYGSAHINVHVSNDGKNWAPFQWIKAMEPTEDITEATYSKTIGSGFINTAKIYVTGDGSSIYILSPVDSFQYMRVALGYFTDGSYSVILGIKDK